MLKESWRSTCIGLPTCTYICTTLRDRSTMNWSVLVIKIYFFEASLWVKVMDIGVGRYGRCLGRWLWTCSQLVQ